MTKAQTPSAQQIAIAAWSTDSFGDMAETVLSDLQQLFDAPMGVLYQLTDSTPIGFVGRGPPDVFERWLPYAANDPLVALKARVNPRLAVTTAQVDQRLFRRSAAYNEIYRPLEIEQQLVIRLSATGYPNPGATSIVLCRTKKQRAWVDADYRLLRRLTPSMESAVRRVTKLASAHQRYTLIDSVVGTLDPTLYGVFGREGQVLWLSDDASTEWPLVSQLTRDHLEVKLRALSQAKEGDLPADLGTRFVWRLPDESMREGEISMHLSPQTGLPFFLLRCPQVQREAVSPGLAEKFGLSRSESVVLALLAEGGTNADIAAKLFVSVNTIRTHVHRILRKMGVSTRQQAAHKLHELSASARR